MSSTGGQQISINLVFKDGVFHVQECPYQQSGKESSLESSLGKQKTHGDAQRKWMQRLETKRVMSHHRRGRGKGL